MPFVITLADWAIQILIYLIVIASLLSWFQPSASNPLVRLLHAVVDPVLHPIRVILPSTMGMDFSPMVGILILWMLQRLLQRGLS
ncbi:MAG: YggT family protein [Holophaga sp.]|nr:YggT family protein [Holophaga sp.]